MQSKTIMQCLESHACFQGTQHVYRHTSDSLNCEMNFAIYVPELAGKASLPVIYWLSGLTCTEQNFITKAGAQRYAAEKKVILVAPDTSPRGEAVADDDSYDLGQGAGFYLNATREPWAGHYHMDTYITAELSNLIETNFQVDDRRSIMGHSMGGHGALTLALRNPGLYRSVSAFSPIVAPSQVPWGEKAFAAYLGDDRTDWLAYDATALLASAKEQLPILIDQGDADDFLTGQLKPELFVAEAKRLGYAITLRMQPGHDHSYYFISSFIGDHIAHHAQALYA